MSKKYRSRISAQFLVFLTMFTSISFSSSYANDVPDITNSAVVEAFVDGVVKPTMKRHNSPSGVVAVMKDGKMIFAKGYGFQDVEKRIPVDPQTTLFRPGSISKLFTWVAVMQLVEQGKLDLDIDINQYLKTFQVKDTWPGQPVTLRHIMTHTAGFETGGLGYLIMNDASRIMPLAEAMAKYQPERINPPGKHTAYSNWSSAVAGLIVANISGMSFDDYIEQNIFAVLGMENSTFREPLSPELDANMAKGYGYGAGQFIEMNYEILSNYGPAGSLASTAQDMSLFARAILNGGSYEGKRILKPETMQQILDEGFAHDDRVRSIGLGFLKRRFGAEDLEIFGHDGGTTLFLSHFGLSLKEDLMVFSSFSGPGAGELYSVFIKTFYDQFFPRSVPVIAPPEDFADRASLYAGTYNSWRNNFTRIEALGRAFDGMQVVPMPDDTLLIAGKRYVEVEKNLFREVNDYGRVAFQEDSDGQITGMVIDGRGVAQYYKAPFYETSGFINLYVGLSLLIFCTIFVRLFYRWKEFRAFQGIEKQAAFASIMVATANVLFFILAERGLSVGQIELTYKLPFILKFSLIFPMLATAAALYHGYILIQVWRQGALVGVWARLRHSVISLCALFMVWFYYYWNLLGFNYLS